MKLLRIVVLTLAAYALAGLFLLTAHMAHADNATSDRSLARAFEAMIVSDFPDNAAWATEDHGHLRILDDAGALIVEGDIPDGAWDGALALIKDKDYYTVLANKIMGSPLIPGDNTWPKTYYLPELVPVALGWEDRVGDLWERRLRPIADVDAVDGDPVKQIEAWFGRQYNRRGGFCCSKADAYPFDGPYELTAKGGVTFQWTDKAGETFTVDVSPDQLIQPKMQMVGDREVVVDGNPTGGAVIWYTGELHAGWNASLYCFAPGQLN